MAVRAELKVQGIEKLQEKLMQKYEAIKRMLDQRLLQLAEDAVTYSKENKEYSDHTANLKNSISFALYYDGNLITMHEGKIPQPDATPKGQAIVSENLQNYAAQDGVVAEKGYSLVIVAGMNYGPYVERKGYNVLYLTRYFLLDELKEIVGEALDIARTA